MNENMFATPRMVRFWPMLNGIESAKLKVKRAVEHFETLQSRARVARLGGNIA
jgi:hypothetical protein